MKKTLYIFVCIAFLPAAAFAQNATLYGMSDSLLTLTEATLGCIAAGNECSEAEILALKADTAQNAHDLVSLLLCGDLQRMMLTGEQAGALRARLNRLESLRLQTSGLLQGVCNSAGVALIKYGDGLTSGFVLGWLAGCILLLAGMLIMSLGYLIILICPF